MDTGYFHVLTIVNNAVMNTGIHVDFQIHVFVFSWLYTWGGTAGSYGSSIPGLLRWLNGDEFT